MKYLVMVIGIPVLFAAFIVSAQAQGYGYGMGPGMMGPGYGGYGGYGMGPGMMGRGYGGYGGYGAGPGRGYANAPGQGYGAQGQTKACRNFLSETQPLRKDLMVKNFEYSEALRNPKADPKTLDSLEKEIADLQEKIEAKNTQGCQW
jgi:hypothetical protein